MTKGQHGLVVAYHLHDDSSFLADSVAALGDKVPVLAFVSKVPWSGEAGNWQETAEIAEKAGADLVLGEWKTEDEHRQAAISECKARGYSHMLLPDGDEIIEPNLLDELIKIADNDLADRVYVEWDTYWKSCEYVIRPREGFRPCILINLENAKQTSLRNHEGGRELILGEEHGIIHHLSYVGDDVRIKRKTTTWSHKDEVVRGWWDKVWCAWDEDRSLRYLHPTHPKAYGYTERIEVPLVLRAIAGKDTRMSERRSVATGATGDWPSISVVIPVYGQADCLKSCLRSLAVCEDLLHEIIVVDNASPDNSLNVCKEFSFVTVVENDKNLGFAKACNQGIEESIGDIVLFLNSDTVVPRTGLIRLIEPLIDNGTVAASGPFTNHCGHFQQIDPTYTDVARLDLFAEDFAEKERDSIEVDMLVGFCLAVRRTALEEVGYFDERFGLGTFEDNDLCYRLRRSGWRLAIASNAYVHHEGSKTLQHVVSETQTLLFTNQQKFLEKWNADLESGYASHLSGTSPGRIKFNDLAKPEVRMKGIERKKQKADISLCMIVKDEERVLADCLNSAKPFFNEMIVVDTGSSDRTIEIADECGADVRHMEWPDSFSVARNESIRDAKGKWIFWFDADDTLPMECGEAILDAAINADDDVIAFVVPVQFVDDGPGGGTRVDHVKLFRNLPDLQFEGRIHEQILGSLREHVGKIARCDAYVLHSGYDTSEHGQKKKRERDEKLLKLDLEDRPDHPFVLFNLGMTAHYTDEHEEAIKWFDKCLEVSEQKESHVRKTYALKAVSQRELGDSDAALDTLAEGLKTVGDDPELNFHMALILSNNELHEEALEFYERVSGCDPSGYFSSMDVGILGFKTHHNMGGVLIALNSYEEARDEFKAALKMAPHFMPSAFELFDQALLNHDFATTLFAIEHVKQNEGENHSWAEMTLKYAEQIGGAENVYATMSPLAAQNIHARKAFASWLVKNGHEEEAANYWPSLQENGDAESAYFLGVQDVRQGRFEEGLTWMRRALILNPDHQGTIEQIQGLESALAEAN